MKPLTVARRYGAALCACRVALYAARAALCTARVALYDRRVAFCTNNEKLEKDIHHIGWGAVGTQLIGHEVHIGRHMLEEHTVTLAEIVQARLAFRRFDEAVFGALTVADEQKRTCKALLWQGGLEPAETVLLPAVAEGSQRLLENIAQLMLRRHKMVA